MQDYGLYLHVPFCKTKCYYCDFNSIAADRNIISRYLTVLPKEIERLSDKYNPQIETIYIGGGTPTILKGEELTAILNECRQKLNLSSDLEITVEANPGTLNYRKLKSIKEAGVNRVSLGVQSFHNRLLDKLGRIHKRRDIIESYNLLREVGFENISFDLMFALPGQSLDDWVNTLNEALELGPEHISAYNLKIESNTVFGQWLQEDKIKKPDKELDLAMYRKTLEILSANNYKQYEISNFSKPGYQSQHNKLYWQNKAYLALGPGAHFYDGEYRGYNLAQINEYCRLLEEGKTVVAQKEKLSRQEKIEESLILGLRLNRGISLSKFKKEFNQPVTDLYKEELDELISQNLIKLTAKQLFLTKRGRELANQVLATFLLS